MAPSGGVPSGAPTASSPAAAGSPPSDATAASAPSKRPAGPRFVFVGVRHLSRAVATDAERHSPWVFGSGAILVAFLLGWLASIILAFRHAPLLHARGRVLQFFAPGSVFWALAIMVAVGLLATGHRLEPVTARRSDSRGVLPMALFLAAGVVGLSALIDFLVELTSFSSGVDAAFSSLVGYAAAMPLAAASAWWALKETGRIHA